MTLLLGVLTTATAWASQPIIHYLDMDGHTAEAGYCVFLDGTETEIGVTNETHWYAVNGTVNYDHMLNLRGDVRIILFDGAVMSFGSEENPLNGNALGNYGPNYSLSIFGQSTGSNNGQLFVNCSGMAIFAYCGDLNISSVRIKATAIGNYAWGIYANGSSVAGTGNVNLKDATVNVHSTHGPLYSLSGNLTINGGHVTATCIDGSAINAQKTNGGGAVTLTGATVTATGTSCGVHATNGLIINSGVVTATSTATDSYYSGGLYTNDCNITVNGGQVIAIGNRFGFFSDGGKIILGCTEATDFILAKALENDNAYNTTVQIAGNQTLHDGIGGSYTGEYSNYDDRVSMSNKMLRLTDDVLLTESTGVTNLSSYVGKANVNVAFNRQFTTGLPSTICLPFPMTDIEGGKVYAFAGIENDPTEGWVATMSDATPDGNLVSATNANTPYLFVPSATNVTFTGTIAEGAANYTAGSTTVGDWQYTGTYTGEQWTEAPAAVYGFSAQAVSGDDISLGEFVKVGAKVRVRPLRAYMTYVGSGTAPANSMRRAASQLPERIRVRLVGANGEVTGIGTINAHTGSVFLGDEAWYSLDGVRLNSKPATKGIYIYKGKKVKM